MKVYKNVYQERIKVGWTHIGTKILDIQIWKLEKWRWELKDTKFLVFPGKKMATD